MRMLSWIKGALDPRSDLRLVAAEENFWACPGGRARFSHQNVFPGLDSDETAATCRYTAKPARIAQARSRTHIFSSPVTPSSISSTLLCLFISHKATPWGSGCGGRCWSGASRGEMQPRASGDQPRLRSPQPRSRSSRAAVDQGLWAALAPQPPGSSSCCGGSSAAPPRSAALWFGGCSLTMAFSPTRRHTCTPRSSCWRPPTAGTWQVRCAAGPHMCGVRGRRSRKDLGAGISAAVKTHCLCRTCALHSPRHSLLIPLLTHPAAGRPQRPRRHWPRTGSGTEFSHQQAAAPRQEKDAVLPDSEELI